MEVRLTWAVAVLCSLALSGCEFSEVDPDAEVTISAEVVSGDGQPLEAQPVVLLTEPTVSDVAFGLPFGLGSLGFACLADDPPPPCDTRRRASTDADGRVAFTLTGRETQGTFGEAARMTLSTTSPAQEDELRGPATTGAFVVRSEKVDLEPLPLIRALPSLAVRDGQAHVDWAWQSGTAMRGTPGHPELVFEVADEPVWATAATDEGFDLRVLEDSRGAVSIGEHRRADGTIDDLTYRSESIGYLSGAGVPRSRGAACRTVHGGGTTLITPCPLTDGDLGTPYMWADTCPDDAACARATGYQIDLGRLIDLDLIVVRGCESECVVSAAEVDEFRPIATVDGPYASVRDAGPAAFLRIAMAVDTAALVEVSVWDGPAAAARLDRLAAPAGQPHDGVDRDRSDERSVWVFVLGGLLVVAVAVGIGVAIGRRP